jgi:hypothetical protein
MEKTWKELSALEIQHPHHQTLTLLSQRAANVGNANLSFQIYFQKNSRF